MYGYRTAVMVLSVLVVDTHDRVAEGELPLSATAQYHESLVPLITSLGEEQNSKFTKYGSYRMHATVTPL